MPIELDIEIEENDLELEAEVDESIKVIADPKVVKPLTITENGVYDTRKMSKPFDGANPITVAVETGGGLTEEEVETIVENKTASLQPKIDERLETEDKTVVGAINELKAKTENLDFEETQADYKQNDETAKDYIKNRPFYEADIEYPSKTYEFDGILDGKEVFEFDAEYNSWFVKISDDKPSIKELLNGQYTSYSNGRETTSTIKQTSIDNNEDDFGFIMVGEAFVVLDSNKAAEAVNPAISEGLWFIVYAENGQASQYPKCIVTTAYTEAEVKKMDEKFLPDTVPAEIDGEVVGEEEFSLQISLKNKVGEVVSTKTIALPKQEAQDIDLSNFVQKTDWIGYDKFGIAKLNSYKGLGGNSVGEIIIREPTNEQLDYRNGGSPKPFTRDTWALTVSKIDYAVKKAITENAETLTDEEKELALEWLGAVTKTSEVLKIYGTDSQGNQVTWNFRNTNNTKNTVAGRDSNGNIQVGTAINDTDATNKKYVEDNFVAQSQPTSGIRLYGSNNVKQTTYDLSTNGVVCLQYNNLVVKPETDFADKKYVENLPDNLTLTSEEKENWRGMIGAMKLYKHTLITNGAPVEVINTDKDAFIFANSSGDGFARWLGSAISTTSVQYGKIFRTEFVSFDESTNYFTVKVWYATDDGFATTDLVFRSDYVGEF